MNLRKCLSVKRVDKIDSFVKRAFFLAALIFESGSKPSSLAHASRDQPSMFEVLPLSLLSPQPGQVDSLSALYCLPQSGHWYKSVMAED